MLSVFKLIGGRYPTTEEGLDALVSEPVGADIDGYEPSLRAEQLDPWGSPYGYEYSPTWESPEPMIFSAGPDMIFGTEDDIRNWEE